MIEAETLHISRKKHRVSLQKRLKALRTATIKQDGEEMPVKNLTVYGNKTLANLLGVSEVTIWTWRNKGIIQGKELAPKIYSYRMQNIIRDLERFCYDDYK